MTALFENRDAALPFEGDELRDLLERSARIQEVVQHPGWQYLYDYIVAITATEQRFILAGNCKTQEEYARRTGKVAGMHAVLDAPSALAERVAEMQARVAALNEEE